MDLQQYRDIFGKPNEGIHSYRLFNIAIIDLLLTILLAYILYTFNSNIKFITYLIILLIIGIILHRLFHVNTFIDRLLFN